MMLEAILTVVIVAAASKAALDAWFEGSIFATFRAYAEVWAYSDNKALLLLGELLTCRFCLGYHVTFWLALLCCFNNFNFIPLVPVWLAARAVEGFIENRYGAKADEQATTLGSDGQDAGYNPKPD